MPDKMETMEERIKQYYANQSEMTPEQFYRRFPTLVIDSAKIARSEVIRALEAAAKECSQLYCQGKCHEDDAKHIRALASRYTNGGG